MPSRQHKDRGAKLLAKAKLPAALEAYRAAVAADPRDLSARRKVAEVLARMELIQEAVAEYQALAGRYASDGRLLEAIAVGKVILQLEPQHTETQRALAQFAARRAQEEEWQARMPMAMVGLIDEERLRAVPESPPTMQVTVRGAPHADELPELPRELMVELLQRLELRSAAPGETIVAEGEPGASMFILAQGSVKVLRGAAEVDRIGEGGLFGEIALLADVPRVASVVADDDCVFLEVPRALLSELSARHASLPAVLQRYFKERLLANLLRSNDIFRVFTREELQRLMERFTVRTVERGDELVKQAEVGPGLFVILRGRCVAYDVPTGHEYPELGEGALFGEISLLELSPATATVRAETRCVLLFLDRRSFAEEILRNPPAARKLEAIARERLERSAKLPASLI